MILRVATVAILVLAAVAVLMFHRVPQSLLNFDARQASEQEASVPAEAFPLLRGDSALTQESLRERALAPYRLRPDRRVLLAVTEVRRLAGGPDSAVTARFAGGRWSLRCGSHELGDLSELPDFPEMLDLLTEWARRQAWTRGWAENAGPERPDLELALGRLDAEAALREADRAWAAGARDAALFRDATRAYTLLALGTPDWAGAADPIAARALATLAYARALGAEDPKREASLLAAVMDYPAAAREQARKLPAKDPVRLFATGDDAGLALVAAAVAESHGPPARPASIAAKPVSAKAAAARRGAGSSATRKSASSTRKATTRKTVPPAAAAAASAPAPLYLEAPFLHLVRVAERGDYEKWSELLTRFERPGVPARPVLGTGLRIESVEAHVPVAERLLRVMTPRTAAPKRGRRPAAEAGPAASLGQRIRQFEAALGASPPSKRGALYDAGLVWTHRRSLVYSALDRIGWHSLESLPPAEMSRWFALAPQSKRSARRATAFHRWYVHLAEARMGRPQAAMLKADVDSAAPGPGPALRSYEALRAYVAAGDPSLRDALRGLVRRMDTRPEHRIALAGIVERDLGALNLAERLGASARGLSQPFLFAWRPGAPGAADSLRALLAKAADPRQRRLVLDWIATSNEVPDSVARPVLERRHAADPDAWEAAERYATWLEKRRDHAAARRVLERWLAQAPEDSSPVSPRVAARTQIARLHQREGHPELGLKALGDLHRGGQFGPMERTALVLQDLGQSHQALAIAWSAHRRFPHLAAGRALLAELFWRQGRHPEAARVLYDGRATLPAEAWTREIAPRFVACFRTRVREALPAAAALMQAGFSDQATVGAIPTAFGAEGLHGLAFALQSRIQGTGLRQIEAATLAYGHLKRARGERAALTWIGGRVHRTDRERLAMVAYQEGHPELLWSMAPARLEGPNGDHIWALRAAVCLTHGQSHPRYSETVRHLDRARGSYYLEIGRYLLGLRDEAEILGLAASMRQRSEIYYFAGLKAEHGGRLRDAADWYLMSVESGSMSNPETRWALRRLTAWNARRAIERVAAPAPPA